jgi:hypothetical protein
MRSSPDPDLFTVREAALCLGVTVFALYPLINAGRLGPIVLGPTKRGRRPMLLQRQLIEALVGKRIP